MSDEDWDTITEEGVDLQDTYPFTDSQILSGQFHQWAAEDYDIAVEYVYPGKFSIFFPLKINILSLAFKDFNVLKRDNSLIVCLLTINFMNI